jgi:hypothetical protein
VKKEARSLSCLLTLSIKEYLFSALYLLFALMYVLVHIKFFLLHSLTKSLLVFFYYSFILLHFGIKKINVLFNGNAREILHTATLTIRTKRRGIRWRRQRNYLELRWKFHKCWSQLLMMNFIDFIDQIPPQCSHAYLQMHTLSRFLLSRFVYVNVCVCVVWLENLLFNTGNNNDIKSTLISCS